VDIRSSMDFQQSQALATAALKPEHQKELVQIVRDHRTQTAIIHYDGIVNVFV